MFVIEVNMFKYNIKSNYQLHFSVNIIHSIHSYTTQCVAIYLKNNIINRRI